MDAHHRKIDLQAPQDLTYLLGNITKAAQEKLDIHFPPSAAPQGEEDAFRTKVEGLVHQVRLSFPHPSRSRAFASRRYTDISTVNSTSTVPSRSPCRLSQSTASTPPPRTLPPRLPPSPPQPRTTPLPITKTTTRRSRRRCARCMRLWSRRRRVWRS